MLTISPKRAAQQELQHWLKIKEIEDC